MVGHKVTNFEVQYYNSIFSKLLTTVDLRKIFEDNGIDTTNIQLVKIKGGTKITKNDSPVSLYLRFSCKRIKRLNFTNF